MNKRKIDDLLSELHNDLSDIAEFSRDMANIATYEADRTVNRLEEAISTELNGDRRMSLIVNYKAPEYEMHKILNKTYQVAEAVNRYSHHLDELKKEISK